MSTQVETGQGYAPSAKKASGSYLPWMIGAVVAAVAIAATLTISASNESESQASSVAEISLTKRQQAQADRLSAAAVAAGAVTPELTRSAQAQADRLTGLAGQYETPSLVVVSGSVLIPAGSEHLIPMVERFTREGTTASPSDFSPEQFRVPLTKAEATDFSPEKFRVPLTKPEATQAGGGDAGSSSGDSWHVPR